MPGANTLKADAVHMLGALGLKELESRKLDPETAVRLGVYTGRKVGENVEPSERGNILVFPRFDKTGEVVLGEKYRGPNKRFFQKKDGQRCLYGQEVLSDPAIYREDDPTPVIWVEGEYDRIAAVQCGFWHTVSPPDGAPTPPKDREEAERRMREQPSEQSDREGKFEFMYLARHDLGRVKRFIIAVDSDAAGRYLASELVRRLGAARCSFVTFPPPAEGFEACKDLTDVLAQYGEQEVVRVLRSAQPYPLKGVYKLSQYPARATPPTLALGLPSLEQHLGLYWGATVLCTGIPSHGKTTLLGNVMGNLAERYGVTSAIISPEMPTVPRLRDRFRRMYLRRDIFSHQTNTYSAPDALLADADDFIERHFSFIEPDPNGEMDEEVTLDWVLERATECVERDGIRLLGIDPWNQLEHSRLRGETEADYGKRALRQVTKWAKRYEVLAWINAHPTKTVGEGGKARMPTPYDVDGGAHWYNAPDFCVIVHRPDKAVNETLLRVAKVRHSPETGEEGTAHVRFNKDSQRFEEIDRMEALL
jgi:twinkle protein